MTITETLFSLRDADYARFQSKLLPTIPAERIIGVRTPQLRKLAKQLRGTKEAEGFLLSLPHTYFDENQLHAFLINEEKDFTACIDRLNAFLPFIDNWATCDQCSPRVFRRHRRELLPQIDRWLADGQEFTVRFGIGMLMQHFLDEDFDPGCLERVVSAADEAYYVHMEVAWYFATALAKQWEAALPYLQEGRLPVKTHNKAIQKARESFRLSPEQKEYLKTLKR